MAKKYGWISAASYGTVAGGCLSHGMSYEYIRQMHLDFPGDSVMRKQREWEQRSIWFKITRFVGLRRGLGKLYPEWIKFFRKQFSWDKVTHAEKVFICFVCTDELAPLAGIDGRFSFLDIIYLIRKASKKLGVKKLSEMIRPKYASDDGVYEAEPRTGQLQRISNDVIPMADAILASFSNPLLGEFKVKYNGKWHRTIDGGIANNHGNLPFLGHDKKFTQLVCDTKLPEKDYSGEKFVLTAYNYWRKPADAVWYLPPKADDLAFFDFPDERVKHEFDGRGMTNGYYLQDVVNLAICGGAADGMGYAPFFKDSAACPEIGDFCP